MIGLNCEEGLGFLSRVQDCAISWRINDKKRGTQLDNRVRIRTGLDRWNQRVKLRCVLRFIRIVYF